MELDYVFISGYCVYGIYAADKLCFSQLSHHRGSEYADVMDWCWFAYMQNKYEMQSNDVVLPRKKYDDFSCLFEMLLLLARERHCQTWFRRTMLIENTHSDTTHIPFAIRKRNEFFSRFKSAEQMIVIFCVCDLPIQRTTMRTFAICRTNETFSSNLKRIYHISMVFDGVNKFTQAVNQQPGH